ncbi:hypothetical protein LTR36_005872 [Oleoguttula mirabilis]|uniref:Proline iminopeptidase n=1 Tax=Oleoguttula mirabilis TaxID=1507867 RepID=A0AAV9JE57_9PEZI|nr:hypothetical protein LTR36_005872 [Oleoguttula mirabilis]
MPGESGYEHADPFDSGHLKVGPIHKIYYEQRGKRDGKPVVFLHGGPGGNTSSDSASFFSPDVHRVVLLDQRGAGKSTPLAELRENTTQHLIDDIETLRKHVGVSKWHMVFGGSWGSTLALAYAEAHPEAVGSLALRGVFLVSRAEIDATYRNGPAPQLYPDEHEAWLRYLPERDREDPVQGYYKLLTSDDAVTRLAAGKAWNRFELRVSQLVAPPDVYAKLEDDAWVLAHARIEAHYFVNDCFLKPGQLLEEGNIARIRHIPTTIVQGRYDVVCPPKAAWMLHKALPDSVLHWVADAGHSAKERGTMSKLIEVCDEYAQLDL